MTTASELAFDHLGSNTMAAPPQLQSASLSADLKSLVVSAKNLYKAKLGPFAKDHLPIAFITAAPGRVNLIGEHVDYAGGFVLPLAIAKYTVVYGTGHLVAGEGRAPTHARIRVVSTNFPDSPVEERDLTASNKYAPPSEDDTKSWVNYVSGVVAQYMPDIPLEGYHLDLCMAFASNIPLGAGLSSSASLEVATAVFVEQFLKDFCFSSASNQDRRPVERALRCQRAENEWAHSPCGIMDQLASSCAEEGHFLFIDCQSLEITQVPMKKDANDKPTLLVCNSHVAHDIADSEYGDRRRELNDCLDAMQQIPLYHVGGMRDATLQDVEQTKGNCEDVAFRRGKHYVTENTRTKECKISLRLGVWERVGKLMNESHESLKSDYEVSCEEIDLLVETAQKVEGVFGSRMTGGGFGGCTVTLVKRDNVDDVIKSMQEAFKAKYNKDIDCFITLPVGGAAVLAADSDCVP